MERNQSPRQFRPIQVNDMTNLRHELNSYIISDSLRHKLSEIFAHMNESNDNIYVQGLFGMGKSYLLKIIGSTLGNFRLSDGSYANNILRKKLVSFNDTTLLNNFDKITGAPSTCILMDCGHRISHQVHFFTRALSDALNVELGYCHNPQIASLEHILVKKGKYQLFKDEYKNRYGSDWTDDRSRVFLLPNPLSGILSGIFHIELKEAEQFIRDLREHSLNVKDEIIDKISNLLTMNESSRLVFIVDDFDFIATSMEEMNGFIENYSEIKNRFQKKVSFIASGIRGPYSVGEEENYQYYKTLLNKIFPFTVNLLKEDSPILD